jgi:hypothetical protein
MMFRPSSSRRALLAIGLFLSFSAVAQDGCGKAVAQPGAARFSLTLPGNLVYLMRFIDRFDLAEAEYGATELYAEGGAGPALGAWFQEALGVLSRPNQIEP